MLHRAAFTALATAGPQPRLCWRGDGEYLELSGHVTATWAAKVANLLMEEDVAHTGARIVLDLPVHWRTAAWALGTWLAGGCVVTAAESATRSAGPADLIVTSDPSRWQDGAAGGAILVAVPLPSFALAWTGPAGPGTLDGAADVAAQPDALGPVPEPDPAAPALEVAGAVVDFQGLSDVDWFAASALPAWVRGEVVTLGADTGG